MRWWQKNHGILAKEAGRPWDYDTDYFTGPHSQVIGAVAVMTAIVCFGSQCVFIKSKRILASGVDPFVVITYFSFGICVCGLVCFAIMAPMYVAHLVTPYHLS